MGQRIILKQPQTQVQNKIVKSKPRPWPKAQNHLLFKD